MSDNLVTFSNATTRDTLRLSGHCSRKATRDPVRIGTKGLSCSTLALDGPRVTAVDRFLHPRPSLAGIQSLVLFDHGDVAGELRILDQLR